MIYSLIRGAQPTARKSSWFGRFDFIDLNSKDRKNHEKAARFGRARICAGHHQSGLICLAIGHRMNVCMSVCVYTTVAGLSVQIKMIPRKWRSEYIVPAFPPSLCPSPLMRCRVGSLWREKAYLNHEWLLAHPTSFDVVEAIAVKNHASAVVLEHRLDKRQKFSCCSFCSLRGGFPHN